MQMLWMMNECGRGLKMLRSSECLSLRIWAKAKTHADVNERVCNLYLIYDCDSPSASG